jgi:GT2 family glycosyltransferase
VDLSIVIVSYNVRELLAECLASVEVSGRGLRQEVIVVDNASRDGSAAVVRDRFGWATVVENRQNAGFARATNQGIRCSRARYILLLNPDSVVLPDCLPDIVTFMDRRSDCGGLTCKVWLDRRRQWLVSNFESADPQREILTGTRLLGHVLAGNRRLESIWHRRWNVWQAQEPCQIDYIQGNFMLVRRSAVEHVGELDERFFMYFEDGDWSRRFRKAGWNFYFYPQADVVHHISQSTKQEGERLGKMYLDSRKYYLRKHFGWFSDSLVRLMLKSDPYLWRLLGRTQQPPSRMGGLIDFKNAPATLSWTPVAGAASYVLELSPNPFFLGTVATWTAGPSAHLPLQELRNTIFSSAYWRAVPMTVSPPKSLLTES